MNSTPFIFHDLQDSQTFALAQVAGKKGFEVHATSSPMMPWVEKSIHIKQHIETPCLSEVGAGQYAASFSRHGIKGVFLTCMDDVASFLAQHETLLKKNGLQFITTDLESIMMVKSLKNLHDNDTLRIAKTQFLTIKELKQQMHELDYPFMIKSERHQFFVAHNAQELEEHFIEYDPNPYIDDEYRIQKYIPGDTSRMATAMLLFDNHGRIVRGFTGRRLDVSPTAHGPYGETTAAKAEWIPEIYEGARDLLSNIGWKGFAEVECKQDVDGQWYIMEINPRLSGWASVAEADGAGFLKAYYDICTQDTMLEEACLQRSTTEYIRISGTLGHLPAWFVPHGKKLQRLKTILMLLHRYYGKKSNLYLVAWDRQDFKASFALLKYCFMNLWKH